MYRLSEKMRLIQGNTSFFNRRRNHGGQEAVQSEAETSGFGKRRSNRHQGSGPTRRSALYTTVYEWRHQLEALGREAFLAKETALLPAA